MTAKTYSIKPNHRKRSNGNDNGVMGDLTGFIPPIAKCAMGGVRAFSAGEVIDRWWWPGAS
jgi:hypothetical protein